MRAAVAAAVRRTTHVAGGAVLRPPAPSGLATWPGGAVRGFAADAKAGAAAGKGGGGGGGGGGKKGKKADKRAIVVKSPTSGRKSPLTHLLPALPSEQRAAARAAGPAAPRERHLDASGAIVSDDETMQQVYGMVNAGRVDYGDLPEEVLSKPVPAPGAPGSVGEELWQRRDELESQAYEGAVQLPQHLKGKVRVVDDDFDAAAQTDVEVALPSQVAEAQDMRVLAARLAGVRHPARSPTDVTAVGASGVDSAGRELLYRLRAAVGAPVHSGFTDTESGTTHSRLPATALPTSARAGRAAPDGKPTAAGFLPSTTARSGGRVGPARAYVEFPDDLDELVDNEGAAAAAGGAGDGDADAGGGRDDRRGGRGGRGGGRRDAAVASAPDSVAALLGNGNTSSSAPTQGRRTGDATPELAVTTTPLTPEQVAEMRARRQAARLAAVKTATAGGDGAATGAAGGEAPALDDEPVAAVVYNSDADEFVARPAYLPLRGGVAPRIVWPNESSAAAEEEALLDEQARSLLSKAGAAASDRSPGAASGAGKPAAGGMITAEALMHGPAAQHDNAFDVRDALAPETLAMIRRRAAGLSDSDSELERLVEMAADYEEGSRIAPAFGDSLSSVPRAVLEELSTPFDFADHHFGAPYPEPQTARGEWWW